MCLTNIERGDGAPDRRPRRIEAIIFLSVLNGYGFVRKDWLALFFGLVMALFQHIMTSYDYLKQAKEKLTKSVFNIAVYL